MAISIITIGKVANGAGGATIALTTTAAAAAGDSIVVDVYFRVQGGVAGTPTVIDSVGTNTYSQESFVNSGSGITRWARFVCHNSAGLASGATITVGNLNTTASSRRAVIAAAITGLDAAPLVDDAAVASAAGDTTPSSGDALAGANNDVIFLGGVTVAGPNVDSFTEDADYSTLDRIGTNVSADTTDRTGVMAYRIVATTETNAYAPTLGTSRNWCCGVSIYKMAGGGGGGTNRRRRVLC